MKKFFCILAVMVAGGLFCNSLGFAKDISRSLSFRVLSDVPYDENLKPEEYPENTEPFTYFDTFNKGFKTVFVEKQGLFFKDSDIKEVILKDNNFGETTIEFTFTEEGAKLLKSFTEKDLGKETAMDVNGTIIVVAIIRDVISGGGLMLSSSETNTIYHVAKAFGLKNDYELSENTTTIKKENQITKIEKPDFSNPTDVITNFFWSIYNDEERFYDYITPETEFSDWVYERIIKNFEEFKESLITKYEDCTITIDTSAPIKRSIMNTLKKEKASVKVNCVIKINNYDYVCEIYLSAGKDGKLFIYEIK